MRPRLIHVKGRRGLACLKLQGLVLIPYPHQAPERIYPTVTEHNLETLTCRLFVFHPLQVLKQNHPGTHFETHHNHRKAFVNMI